MCSLFPIRAVLDCEDLRVDSVSLPGLFFRVIVALSGLLPSLWELERLSLSPDQCREFGQTVLEHFTWALPAQHTFQNSLAVSSANR